MSVYIIKDGEHTALAEDLESAISGAEQLLDFQKDAEVTYALVGEDRQLLASVTNRRIKGNFTRQKWGGPRKDNAIDISTEEFDATTCVLQMRHEALIALRDYGESAEQVGRACIGWNGPCLVTILDSVCSYFGADDIRDITPEALAFALERKKAELPRDEVVTVSLTLKLRIQPGAILSDFGKELDINVTSTTQGVTVLDVLDVGNTTD